MDSPIFIDTCTLADAITPIVYELGFMKSAVVLRSISLEMTKLCASDKPEKQHAGQQALLTLARLHSLPGIEVIMDDDEPTTHHPDDDLVKRAWLADGRIFTADTALQQKARQLQIEIIAVQQYRELLSAVTPKLTKIFPPMQDLAAGTVVTVCVVKLGNKPGQGVGFLPDRRMVVVEGGEPYLGGEIKVQVTRTLQPDSGLEIVFAVAIQRNSECTGTAGR